MKRVLPDQLHLSNCVALIEQVAPVENDGVKPRFGFWTSTYREGISEWVEAAEDMDFAPYAQNWFVLAPREARVLVIDTLQDLKHLLDRYPHRPIKKLRMRWLDFEAIAEEWDAIHLTSGGQWATRLTHPDSLYGWDSESTLWFRWCFESWRRIETAGNKQETA